MAYDQDLADAIRDLVSGADGVTEMRMFGGLAFLINGNMAVAASGQGGLLLRADPNAADDWLADDRVTPMVMRGREMRGWLRVASDADDPELERWISRGVAYARSLPAKGASPGTR